MIAYDIKLLTDWDHTAVVAAGINTLTCVVINAANSKARAKPKPVSHFNPYRKRVQQGMKITASNIADLKLIGRAMRGG